MLVFFLGRWLIDKHRSAWTIEITFLLTLIVSALFGWVLNFFLPGLSNDPGSSALIGWLYFLPPLGTTLWLIVGGVIIIEIGYWPGWFNHFRKERARIVEALNSEHSRNVEDVTRFVAEAIALYLLQRVGLIGEKGKPGEYFHRINQLNRQLKDVRQRARKEQDLARTRLSLSDTSHRPSIGNELLEIGSLEKASLPFTQRLNQGDEELKELSELLVRAMGQEKPAELEQQLRKRPSQKTLPFANTSRRYLQVLMVSLVATALLFSVTSPSEDSITPLIERYESIEDDSTALTARIKTLNHILRDELSKKLLQPTKAMEEKSSEEMTDLATSAFEAWGQMLWEGQVKELDMILSSEGVVPKLLADGDDIRLARRLLDLPRGQDYHNDNPGQTGTRYLLLPPSPQAEQLWHKLGLSKQNIIDLPDVERVLFLNIQNYRGESIFIADASDFGPLSQADEATLIDSQVIGLPINTSATTTKQNEPTLLGEFAQNAEGAEAEESQFSFFALARVDLEENDRARVGESYSVQVGVSRNDPRDFEGESFDLTVHGIDEPIIFDVLIHTSKNIELRSEWHKVLSYNPRSMEPQFVAFAVQVVTPGPCTVEVDFYHERRWITSTQLEFDAIEMAQLTTTSSEV